MLDRAHPPGSTADANSDPAPSCANLTPVSVRNLTYRPAATTLLSDLNFEIPSATKTVIMGPNGAGKSLLMRLLHGLLTPTSGTVLWNGIEANTEIQKRQAMIFQRPVVLRRTARANIQFVLSQLPRAQRDTRTNTILESANLSAIAETPARLLSGGEQQRLAIARAQATDPKVLFLDEPTAALDPASTHAIEETILKASQSGTKIILITHDIGQARRLADDVIFLDRGHLCEHAPAKQFFDAPKSPAADAYLSGHLYLGPPT